MRYEELCRIPMFALTRCPPSLQSRHFYALSNLRFCHSAPTENGTIPQCLTPEIPLDRWASRTQRTEGKRWGPCPCCRRTAHTKRLSEQRRRALITHSPQTVAANVAVPFETALDALLPARPFSVILDIVC